MMKYEAPIDIVYLWVDGTDPVWRLKRERAKAELNAHSHGELAAYSNVEGRFRDNEELRYSLRALDKFFPDHGHIYIVTDAQVPAWLCNSQRVTVIDHRDLIPAACLPTFDSGNIETYIHRIPGLSERYFYFNDDVFFGAPVKVSDWFWEGGIYVAWSDERVVSDEPLRPDANSLENACRRSNQWFNSKKDRFMTEKASSVRIDSDYEHTFRTFAHSPRPMLKSVLIELEALAPELFASVRSTVFRTWREPTLVSDFVMRWALATGRGKVCEHSHFYVSTGEPGTQLQLDLLRSKLGQLDFFCINDTTDDAAQQDPRLEKVRETMASMFPDPSHFERRA
jgi:hypothetical protein